MGASSDYMSKILGGLFGGNNQAQSQAPGSAGVMSDPTTQFYLTMLANSNTPGGFGSIFGKSAVEAQKDYQAAQVSQQQLQKGWLDQQMLGQKMAFLNAPGGMGGPQAPPQQPQQAAQGQPDPSQGQAPQGPQQGQAFGFTQPPQAQGAPQGAQQPNPYLTPPTQQDISSIPIGGMSGDWLARYQTAIEGKSPLEAYQSVHTQQEKLAQQQMAPKLASLDYLLKSDKPSVYMQADKQLMQAWPQLAAQAGLDPQKDYNDDGVRHALTFARNQFATAVGLPGVAPTNRLVDVGNQQRDPITGKVEHEEGLEDVDLGDGKHALLPQSQAIGKPKFNATTAAAAQLQDPKVSALDAALTTAGVNIPGGRNGQQRIASLQNLIRAYPDSDPQQIADKVRTGQLDFNGAKRSTGQLSTLSAAADIQSRKIEKDLNSLGPIVQRLPGGPAKIANALTNLQKDWSWNGDKDTTEAVGYIKELAGEYAKLVSGSTGMAAPAEGEMKSALGLMQSALTKNGYEGMHEFLSTTSQNRRDAVREGLKNAARPGTATGATTPTTNANGWVLHTDKNGNQAYVSPDGKSFEEVK